MGYTPRFIELAQPSCALNSPKPKRFSVAYSPVIDWDLDAAAILGGYIPPGSKHLIINAHGQARPDPIIELGKSIRSRDVALFEPLALRHELNVIWFSSCNIALSVEGVEFCKAVAIASRCYVVAHTMVVPDEHYRVNCIEDYVRSMPVYIDRFGVPIARDRFFSAEVAGAYGFRLR